MHVNLSPLVGLALAVAFIVAIALRSRRRLRRLSSATRVVVGPESAAAAQVGQDIPVRRGQRDYVAHVTSVDADAGALEVVLGPPPAAAERGAEFEEVALLRALGFDPKTHDLRPVAVPWRGVQVLKGGERVRFFTERQVKTLASVWKASLRAEKRAVTG